MIPEWERPSHFIIAEITKGVRMVPLIQNIRDLLHFPHPVKDFISLDFHLDSFASGAVLKVSWMRFIKTSSIIEKVDNMMVHIRNNMEHDDERFRKFMEVTRNNVLELKASKIKCKLPEIIV